MLTATDNRSSRTAKIKKSYFTKLLHIDVGRCAAL